jgi:uncharacterized low-complexity protein
MNKTTRNTVIALGLGAAFSFAVPAAQAAGNPFAMQTLDHGYTVADAGRDKDGNGAGNKKEAAEEKTSSTGKAKDGKCGEGKCGGSKPKAKAGKPKAKAGKANT